MIYQVNKPFYHEAGIQLVSDNLIRRLLNSSVQFSAVVVIRADFTCSFDAAYCSVQHTLYHSSYFKCLSIYTVKISVYRPTGIFYGKLCGYGLHYSVDLRIQTKSILLKYGTLTTKYLRIYGYFFTVYVISEAVEGA